MTFSSGTAARLAAPSGAKAPEHRQASVTIGNIGQMRLFVVRKLSRHGRQWHAYWQAYRAEREDVPTRGE